MIEVTEAHESFSDEDVVEELCTLMLAVCAVLGFLRLFY
jgi:hypothetical protein